MGYYVSITKSDCKIAAEVKSRVYKTWCDLNHPRNNHQKRGGSYSGGAQTAWWYSWMTEHYDQECKTVEEILDMLGFGYDKIADGSILVTDYDSKTGQEELFFKAVAHLLTGTINWRGEEDARWSWTFHGSAQALAIEDATYRK